MYLGDNVRSSLHVFAISFSALCVGAVPAAGQDHGGNRMQVGVGVGSLGVMVEPSLRWSPSFGVRLPIGTGSLDRTEEVEGNVVKGTMRLGGMAVIVDYFPFGSGLRVSGGLLSSNFRLRGTSTGKYELNGEDYEGSLSVYAKTRNRLNPVFALAYDRSGADAGWSISSDLGVIYSDGLRGNVDASVDNILISATQKFEDDIAAARESLRNDLKGVKLLPYVKLSVTFRF